MKKIQFQNATQTAPATVTINGVNHDVAPAVIEGGTLPTPDNLNQLQNNVEAVLNGEESIEKLVVGDIECKNLFNINGERTDKYNIVSTVSENKLSTECTGAWSYLEYYNIKVEKGQTYTVSFDFSNPSNNSMGLDIRSATGSSILGSASSTDVSGSKKLSFIADGDTVTMRICSNNTDAVNTNTVTYSNIQIEKGSIATSYSKYKKIGYNSQESMGKIVVDDISCKNLVSELIYNGIGNVGTTYQIVGNEKIIVNSNNNKWAWVEVVIKNVPINQKLTFSCDFVSGGNANVSAIIYDENGNKLAGFDNTTATNGKINMVFSTPTSSIKYRCAANNSGTELTNTATYSNIQLERGTVATEYTPYKEFSNKQIYSTNEQVIGTWIDGKPLYRKTIKSSTPSIEGNNIIPHGISNIDSIANAYGCASYLNTYYVLGAHESSTRFVNIKNVNETNITIVVSADWATSFTGGFTITLEYTKK